MALIEEECSHRKREAGLFIHLLGGHWTLASSPNLPATGRRYQELHDAVSGISYKVLTETLRRAERDGLISRRLDEGRIETGTFYEGDKDRGFSGLFLGT